MDFLLLYARKLLSGLISDLVLSILYKIFKILQVPNNTANKNINPEKTNGNFTVSAPETTGRYPSLTIC